MDGTKAIQKGLIAIKDDTILYIGTQASAPPIKAERIIEGHGKVAIPGLINCHTHSPMTLFRGLAENQRLSKWLTTTIWPLEAKLRSEDVYDGALLGCLEMIKSGTTCFADMYFHEEMVAEAVEKAGLRAVLAPGILEVGNKKLGENLLEKSLETAQKYQGYAGGRVGIRFGPHAAYTCSPELLKKVREKSSAFNVGIHIHLAESVEMANEVKEKYGLTEAQLLESIGFLGPDVLAAHAIYLSEKEMEILAKQGVKVSYNPIANIKFAHGVAKVKDLSNLGVTVGIGTDGPASNNILDMFESMKFAILLQKLIYGDPTVFTAHSVLEMATLGGARALGLEEKVGSLEAGKKADIVLIDFKKPHLTPTHDIYTNVVYSARGSDVETVIVDGTILMENRKLITLNEEDTINKAQKTASDLLTR
jgi:5-methylthioadenosine/S-adenosylhomocysteine deaminase